MNTIHTPYQFWRIKTYTETLTTRMSLEPRPRERLYRNAKRKKKGDQRIKGLYKKERDTCVVESSGSTRSRKSKKKWSLSILSAHWFQCSGSLLRVFHYFPSFMFIWYYVLYLYYITISFSSLSQNTNSFPVIVTKHRFTVTTQNQSNTKTNKNKPIFICTTYLHIHT